MATLHEELTAEERHELFERDYAEYKAGRISTAEYFTRLRSRIPPQTSNAVDLIREDRDDPDPYH